MINLNNIHPLTDFKRNARAFVEQIKATKNPLVLTVNGKAEVVVQDAASFQAMAEQLHQTEEELRALKLEILRGEVLAGVEQINTGVYTDYDDNSLPNLLDNIKSRGREKLSQKRTV
jgi:prevent-host-death family protein